MTHKELFKNKELIKRLPGPEACLESLHTGTKEIVSSFYSLFKEYYEYRAQISTTEVERAGWKDCIAFIDNPNNRE